MPARGRAPDDRDANISKFLWVSGHTSDVNEVGAPEWSSCGTNESKLVEIGFGVATNVSLSARETWHLLPDGVHCLLDDSNGAARGVFPHVSAGDPDSIRRFSDFDEPRCAELRRLLGFASTAASGNGATEQQEPIVC